MNVSRISLLSIAGPSQAAGSWHHLGVAVTHAQYSLQMPHGRDVSLKNPPPPLNFGRMHHFALKVWSRMRFSAGCFCACSSSLLCSHLPDSGICWDLGFLLSVLAAFGESTPGHSGLLSASCNLVVVAQFADNLSSHVAIPFHL